MFLLLMLQTAVASASDRNTSLAVVPHTVEVASPLGCRDTRRQQAAFCVGETGADGCVSIIDQSLYLTFLNGYQVP
jgi:hypothetical protein